MKIRNGIIMAVVASLFLSCSIAAAETVTDPEGDVYHQIVDGTSFTYEVAGDREHIDITDLTHTVSENDITLSLSVKDSIATDNSNILYWIYLQAIGLTETDYYFLSYSQGQGFISAAGQFAGFFDMEPDYSISSDGKTLSYTFEGVDTSNSFEPWGFAIEYLDFSSGEGGEAWVDYAPGTYAPWYAADPGGDTGDDDDPDDDDTGDDSMDDEDDNTTAPAQPGTPGFETLAVIAALGVTLILLRRRK